MELGKIKNYSQTSKLEILKHLKEGKVFDVDENIDLKTSEVSTSIPKDAKIEKDDKKAFEEYKAMYKDIITQKCIEDYGTDIDKQLWEDTAKELFLKTKTYIPTGEEKSQGTLDKKEENKLQLESRDRVAENLSKFIYDLTTEQDTETYGETAWSGNQPTKMGNVTVYEVYKNGKSNYTMEDIKKAVLEKFPELNIYGTSYSSIFFYKPQKTESKLQEDTTNLEYNYMLLDRLKQDCEYFLGNGNGNVDTLWAKDIDEQIAKMKELYNSFTDEEKPEWITMEDINNYEKEMKEYNKEKKTEDVSDLQTIQDIEEYINNIKDEHTKSILHHILEDEKSKENPSIGYLTMAIRKVLDIEQERNKEKKTESMPDDWYKTMYDKYVPNTGEASTIGGEILRTFSGISRMFYQNGDKIWRGNMRNNSYVLDPLADKLDDLLPQEGKDLMSKMANSTTDNAYEKRLNVLEDYVYNYLKNNDNLFGNDKDKKEETAISNYTLNEIKKVIDSNGNDFTIKIVNSNEDIQTKTLNIDREDLINIYNVLGNNKITENKITESLTEKDDIIKAIQNCYDEEQLEDVIYSVQDEKLSDILMENALDLKSEMGNSKGFNKMKTYKQNLVNVVIDYFEDPDMFE